MRFNASIPLASGRCRSSSTQSGRVDSSSRSACAIDCAHTTRMSVTASVTSSSTSTASPRSSSTNNTDNGFSDCRCAAGVTAACAGINSRPSVDGHGKSRSALQTPWPR
ncbi:putative lipoprotein [Mycobacterium avium subsp. avium 2285 (R)]|nr:putative lipoprotein [Mycobacterium avium subsp. avium 2285 (R)]